MKDPSISLWGPHQLPASPKQTFQKQQSPFSILDPTYTVTQNVRSNLFPVKDPSISLWGPHQLPASPKQTFWKQQSPFSILDPTCTAVTQTQLVPSERPFNFTVGTSPVACKPKANFPETTIPIFNFRSNLHRCHADSTPELLRVMNRLSILRCLTIWSVEKR